MKNLLGYLPVIILAFSLIGGWFRLSAQSETNAKEIIAIKAEMKEAGTQAGEAIEELKEDNIETDKAITAFTIEQKYIQTNLKEVNESLKELIKELKK